MGSQWSSRARSVVSEWQERLYGQLAEDLGWGWDPQRAFKHFSTPQLAKDDYRLSVDRLRDIHGRGYYAEETWQEIERAWNEYKETYYHIEPPTKYEDAHIYSNALANLSVLTPLIEHVMPGHMSRTPRIATLPSGDLMAKIKKIRGSDEVVILIQQGLAGFIYHFSNIVACAIPTKVIKSRKPVPSAKDGNPGDAELVDYAARYLANLIDAYVVNGDPYLLSNPNLRGRAFYNQSVIGIAMRQFPISHELTHLVYRHIDAKPSSKDDAWNREFLADELGSSLVGGFAKVYDSESLIPSIWAVDVVLAGFEMLLECVALLDAGSKRVPDSGTHPSLGQRRDNVFQFNAQTLHDLGSNEDARSLQHLFNQGAEVLDDLSGRIAPHMNELRRRGVKPSPIWRARDVPES